MKMMKAEVMTMRNVVSHFYYIHFHVQHTLGSTGTFDSQTIETISEESNGKQMVQLHQRSIKLCYSYTLKYR